MPINYALNPDFELNSNGWAGAGGSTIARTTTGPRTGTGAGLLSATSTTNAVATSQTTNLPSPGGKAHSFGAWLRWATGATRRAVRLDVLWYDGVGNLLSTVLGAALTPALATYGQVTLLNAIAPSNAVHARLRLVILTPAAGDAVRIDDVQIVQGSSLADPIGPVFTLWNGTAEVPVAVSFWDGASEVPIASSTTSS